MINFETSTQQYGTSLKDIESALIALSKKSLLVGVFNEGRTEPESEEKQELTNSELAFIFEFGAPEVKIPARSFMFPTLRDKLTDIQGYLLRAAEYALQGDNESVDKTLSSLGIELVAAIKDRILKSIPPALSKNTLRKLITETKRRSDYGTTPLKVTGQFVNSFNYSVENK